MKYEHVLLTIAVHDRQAETPNFQTSCVFRRVCTQKQAVKHNKIKWKVIVFPTSQSFDCNSA